MNWENIRRRYIEIGMPIMLTGIIIMAIGYILDYVTRTIYDVSYIQIHFLVLLGMLFIVIGAFSMVILVRHV